MIQRADYAAAGISAYWIINSAEGTIVVLRLEESTYVEHGVFRRGDTATSALLQGFTVSVKAVCNAE